MTFMLCLLGVVLFGVSGRLVARAIVVPRLQLKLHLREIQDYGFESSSEEVTGSREQFTQAVGRLATRVGKFMMRNFKSLSPLKSGDLTAAGFYDITPEAVHGYRALAAIGMPIVILLLVLVSGGLSALRVLLVVLTAAAGWQLPAFIIRKRGSSRLDEIDRQLPELIDLLIATVEAGMGFAASLSLVANRFRGALGAELRLTMQQQSLGISTREALEDMVDRCDTQSVRTFVRTVTRGETLGVSIGPILRELSGDMRRRRRMAAKERMMKAPVKMIFPLMFLIMPALMIVLLYPAVYSVAHNSVGL
jgi:Flp pilus assembly protein TadB